MKKKVLYGVALALFASVGMGTLQSCKDDLSDFKHQYSYDQTDLLKRVSDLEIAVKACKEDCKERMDQLEADIRANADNIADLDEELRRLNGELSNYVTYTALEERLLRVKNEYESYTYQQIANAVSEINANIDGVKTELEDKMSELSGKVDDLQTTLNGLNDTVSTLSGKVDENAAAIASINEKLETYETALRTMDYKLQELEATVLGHTEEIEGLKLEIQGVIGMVEEAFLAIQENQQIMTQMMNMLMDQIDETYNKLTDRIDNMITSIVLQGADCPVFGNLNLPLGIQSNILFNWYGYNDLGEEFDFPSASPDYNYYDGAPVLTQTELQALKPKFEKIVDGVFGDVNLGKFYMTINPAGNFFNPEGFKLETSKENQFPATLTVRKSTDEIFFGYTRATVLGNGFYEAEVTVKKNDISAAKMDVNEGLKSSMEAALNDPSKRTAVELLKGIYSQFNGTLPAYAVRYNWTTEDEATGEVKTNSVLSNYGIAATTAKPLSYSFLYDKGSNKKLRPFGHIDSFIERFKERLNGNLTFSFDNKIEVGGKEISWTRVTNFREAGEGRDKHIEATVVGLTVDGTVYPDFDINCGSEPEKVSEMITKGLIEKIWGTDVSEATKTEAYAKITVTLLEMQKQIAEVIKEINGTVDNAVNDAFDQVESYADRLNRIIDLYNKVAGKINKFLSNPNQYLQVAMFYKQAGGGMGLLSNDLNSPTPFNYGNGNISVYASSYTGEIVAPAYMKYVAVTNVYDANTREAVVNAKTERDAVNEAAKNFNTVMPGKTIRYAVPAKALKSGRIYEIVYQGVDYSGRTSTQKFYIQVN